MLIGIALIIIFLAIIAYGSSRISSGMFIKTKCSLSDKSKILLTFDDGPDEQITPTLLDTLRHYNIKAIFFVIGEKAQQNPELIKRIVNDGHIVGNHTFHHNPKYLFYSKRRILEEELQSADAVLRQHCNDVVFFRPPLGVTNDSLAWAVRQMNYKTIGWNIRSFDTRRERREKVLNRVLKHISGGNIILLHDRMPHVEWIVDEIVKFAQTKHLSFVSMNEDLPW